MLTERLHKAQLSGFRAALGPGRGCTTRSQGAEISWRGNGGATRSVAFGEVRAASGAKGAERE